MNGTVHVRTWGVALYLCGRGFKPVGVELSRDGLVGDVVFLFPAEAQTAMADYRASKEALTVMSTEIRSKR